MLIRTLAIYAAEEFAESVWKQFAQSVQAQFVKESAAEAEFSAALLKTMDAELDRRTKAKTYLHDLIVLLTDNAVSQCETHISTSTVANDGSTEMHPPRGLLALLKNCNEVIFEKAELAHVRVQFTM